MKVSLLLLIAALSGNAFAETCNELIRPNQDFKTEILLDCKVDAASKTDSTALSTSLDQKLCIEIGTYKTGATFLSHAFFTTGKSSGSQTFYNGKLGLTKTEIKIGNDSISLKSREKVTLGGYFPKEIDAFDVRIDNLQSEKQTYSIQRAREGIVSGREVVFQLKATCQREL